jgi:hypothetical protein
MGERERHVQSRPAAIVRALEKDSTLACTMTSAPIPKDEQHDLFPGESMIANAGETVAVRLRHECPMRHFLPS